MSSGATRSAKKNWPIFLKGALRAGATRGATCQAGGYAGGSECLGKFSSVADASRTGHTREPEHLEQKHKTTRKAATHERTPDRQTSRTLSLSHTHTHRSRDRGRRPDVNRKFATDDTARLSPTLTQPPPRASASACGTIACASSTDPSASASARRAPCLPLHLNLNPGELSVHTYATLAAMFLVVRSSILCLQLTAVSLAEIEQLARVNESIGRGSVASASLLPTRQPGLATHTHAGSPARRRARPHLPTSLQKYNRLH